MTTRREVYEAIDTERAYQDQRWNAETTASEGRHEPEAFLLYVEHYVGLARAALSSSSVQVAYPQAQEIFRKIAALCVAEMEQHGAPLRALGLAASLRQTVAGSLDGNTRLVEDARYFATRHED